MGYLVEIDKAALDHRKYVQSQQESGKPLYKWSEYDGYPTIRDSARELENAVNRLDEHFFIRDQFSSFLPQARRYSTSISNSIEFVLAVINKKIATYQIEMDNSTLTEDEIAKTNARITSEVQKVLGYCVMATEHVWAATERLVSLRDQSPDIIPTGESWISPQGTVMLSAAISAAIAITIVMMSSLALSHPALAYRAGDNLPTQVVGFMHHTQAITNLTAQIHSIKLDEIEKRYEDLSARSEAHGLRLDNIVDSLGPPNELGVYYSSQTDSGSQSGKGIEARNKKIFGNTQRQVQRLQEELNTMRKDMKRMEIRLGSDINKVRHDMKRA